MHGTPTLNTLYWTEDRPDSFCSKMAKAAGAREGDLIAFGHTHKPWTREVEGVGGGRDNEEVATAGECLEVLAVWPGLSVDDDVLVTSGVAHGLALVDYVEGQLPLPAQPVALRLGSPRPAV